MYCNYCVNTRHIIRYMRTNAVISGGGVSLGKKETEVPEPELAFIFYKVVPSIC
jgi:hypothetical protein